MTAAINGKPALSFDGSNDMFRVDNNVEINSAGPYLTRTLVVAFKTNTNVTNRQVLWEEGDNVRGMNLYIDQGQVYANVWNLVDDDGGATTPFGPAFVSGPVALDTVYVVMVVLSSDSDDLDLYINGTLVSSTSNVGRLFSHVGKIGVGGIWSQTYFHDATSATSGKYFKGHIAELLMLNSILPSDDRDQLEAYFHAKYNN